MYNDIKYVNMENNIRSQMIIVIVENIKYVCVKVLFNDVM